MTASITTLKDYAELRKSIGGLQKSGENPHFKNTYVELNAIIDAVDEVIEKHNFITYLQPASHRDGKNFLKTQLFHNSGEVIETELELITTKNDPQMMGSSITYMRRYGLMSILGLKAEDDDGNGGSGKVKPASDADFNAAKKRMAKAKYAYSFKEFMAGFNREKAYNSAQVELLEQTYDHEKAKIKENLTPELVNKTKDAMKKKNFDGSFEQYLDMLKTKYEVSKEQEEDLKAYFLEESQKLALQSRDTGLNPDNINEIER